MIESKPEYALIILIYIPSFLNLIFLLYIILNYVFKNWIIPKIESKIKSKWLLWFINYNKKVSTIFVYYSFFMLLFNTFNVFLSLSLIIFFTNLFNTPTRGGVIYHIYTNFKIK
jgi:hypothetical protein